MKPKMRKLILLFSFLMINIASNIAQEVGIIMGTARHLTQNDTEGGLQKLQKMGIKYIEGAGSRSMARADYKKLLDKYGFDVVAGGASFDKLENTDSVKSVIENLKYFGADYAVCYWIPHKGDDFTFEDMKKGIAVFNKAGKQMAEAGISLLYHAHGYEFRPYDGQGTMYDYMMENLDPKYVNIEMDVFWMRNPGQNPAALLRKYAGRYPITHLKDRMFGSIDNLNGRQDVERNVVLGQGDVNIAEVMKAAKETGVKYHFIEDESSRAYMQLPMSLQYLRGLEADQQALELSLNGLHNAMVKADSVALKNLLCNELTYGHSNGMVDTKESFVKSITSAKAKYSKIEMSAQDITIKENVAWARYNMLANVESGGKPNVLNIKLLTVWMKENEVWKLLARQAIKQ